MYQLFYLYMIWYQQSDRSLPDMLFPHQSATYKSGLYVRIYSVPSFFNVVFILSEKEKLLSYIYGAGITKTAFSSLSSSFIVLSFLSFAVNPSALILNEYVCLFIGASDKDYIFL